MVGAVPQAFRSAGGGAGALGTTGQRSGVGSEESIVARRFLAPRDHPPKRRDDGRASRAAILEGRPLPAGLPSSLRVTLRVPLRDTPPATHPCPLRSSAPAAQRRARTKSWTKSAGMARRLSLTEWQFGAGLAYRRSHSCTIRIRGPTWDFATPERGRRTAGASADPPGQLEHKTMPRATSPAGPRG